MTTFVLVHGAWHDGSCWDQVIEHLDRLGHEAFAPTAAGHGKGAARDVTHDESTDSIVEFIVKHDLTDFVLLGHSYGGTLICKVAEAISDRIRRLVYLSGFVLSDGESIVDNVPPDYRALFGRLEAESLDATIMLPFPIWRETFMNDADLPLARACYDQLSPQPGQTLTQPIDLRTFYKLDTPRSYITGLDDNAVPPGEWGFHPKMSARLGLHRLLRMPGGHELFFTNPAGLAEKIIEAGRD
jgi:pimeloyl-ACP methyl ester carboxylesterase